MKKTAVPVVVGARRASRRTPLIDALALGRDVWDELLVKTGAASPFMSWAWHRAWADSTPAADASGSEAVLVPGPDDAVEALLPVAVRPVRFRRVPVKALTWAIDDLACPDHLDILAGPEASLEAMVPVIEAMPWDVIILSNVAEGVTNTARLGTALARHGHVVTWIPGWSCPYLMLPASWDDYLATLTRSRRQELRRNERKLMRDHAAVLKDYGVSQWQEGWRHLRMLHEARWNGAGALSSPQVDQFHQRFAREWAQRGAGRGEVWLTTLDLEGQPAAAWYGFVDEDTVYFYQSGRDPRWERASVGTVLIGLMIQRAIERGYRRFDFLRGEDAYKLGWTTTRRTTHELVVFRRGLRGRWLRCVHWAGALKARLRARWSKGK